MIILALTAISTKLKRRPVPREQVLTIAKMALSVISQIKSNHVMYRSLIKTKQARETRILAVRDL